MAWWIGWMLLAIKALRSWFDGLTYFPSNIMPLTPELNDWLFDESLLTCVIAPPGPFVMIFVICCPPMPIFFWMRPV